MFLMSPPKWILFEYLELFEVLAHAPSFIVGQRESVFLKEGIYAGDSSIPRIFQIIKC